MDKRVIVACPQGHLKITRNKTFICHGVSFSTPQHVRGRIPTAPQGKGAAKAPPPGKSEAKEFIAEVSESGEPKRV